MRKRPVFKFKYIYKGRGDEIQLIVTDNKGKQVRSSKKIIKSLGESFSLNSKLTNTQPIDYWIKYPNIWKINSTEEVIKRLYGLKELKTGGVKLAVNKYPTYYANINIASELELKSIAVLTDDTRCIRSDKIPSLRAIISIPNDTLIDYDLEIIIFGDCYGECCGALIPITIVSEDNEGNLYQDTTNVNFYGCNHGCEGDGS